MIPSFYCKSYRDCNLLHLAPINTDVGDYPCKSLLLLNKTLGFVAFVLSDNNRTKNDAMIKYVLDSNREAVTV